MADNVVLGAGRLYVATLDGDDDPGPERYMGDSPGASLSGGEGERLTIFASDGADRSRKLVDKVLDVTRTMTLTLRDMSFENLALFLTGTYDADGEAAAAVAKATPEQYPACKAGDEFQVGVYVAGTDGGYDALKMTTSVANKHGFVAGDSGNAVENDTDVYMEPSYADWLENDEAPTSKALGGDGTAVMGTAHKAVLFADIGRVRVLADLDSGFRLSYTPATPQRKVVSSTEQPEVAVRYVEHEPSEGAGRSVYVTKATVAANGELALKQRDAEQQLGLTVSVLGKVVITGGASA